jgi:hypothetical protein
MSRNHDLESSLTYRGIAEVFGQVFEAFVKRGVLWRLADMGIVGDLAQTPEHIAVPAQWGALRLEDLEIAFEKALGDQMDGPLGKVAKDWFKYMSTYSGLGHTAIREYFKSIGLTGDAVRVKALWCPLTLPQRPALDADEARVRAERNQNENAVTFCKMLNMKSTEYGVSKLGYPANADFLLWFSNADMEDGPDYLLVHEYSMRMPNPAKLQGAHGDFSHPSAHLEAIRRHQRCIDMRNVFTDLSVSIDDRAQGNVDGKIISEGLRISDNIGPHLHALSSRDKPLYKICQACSYATEMGKILIGRGYVSGRLRVRSIAITPDGNESLSAIFGQESNNANSVLMSDLGRAYRTAKGIAKRSGTDSPEAYNETLNTVCNALIGKLPLCFRKIGNKLKDGISRRRHVNVSVSEWLASNGTDISKDPNLDKCTRFYNPADMIDLREALSFLPEDGTPEMKALCDHYKDVSDDSVQNIFSRAFKRKSDETSISSGIRNAAIAQDMKLSLRDLHAACVEMGLELAQPGRLNMLALEGNPGIGKTTAVINYLTKGSGAEKGFLFLYLSPRIAINDDVVQKIATGKDGKPTGILAMTTNRDIADSARKKSEENPNEKRHDGAVVIRGVRSKPHVRSNFPILLLDQEEAANLESEYSPKGWAKKRITESQELIYEEHGIGVLRMLAMTTREVLDKSNGNTDINRLAITVAVQAFRKAGMKSTLSALDAMFPLSREESKDGRRFLNHMASLAQRIPRIIVMVDEVTGDGAGAPFVIEVARWLKESFITPLKAHKSEIRKPQFEVSLIVADASLATDTSMTGYLESAGKGQSSRVPAKVMVGKAAENSAFGISAGKCRLKASRPAQTLHVMANSFPAGKLEIIYDIDICPIEMKRDAEGRLQTLREAVGEHDYKNEKKIELAFNKIVKFFEGKCEQFTTNQLIFFAQDKQFLSDLKTRLVNSDFFKWNEIQIVDSIHKEERTMALEESGKESSPVRIWLMTSSGTRGLSFPRANVIIAMIPQFNVTRNLMEISQLIYRGRGSYRAKEANGKICYRSMDGQDRKVVLLFTDYVLHESEDDYVSTDEHDDDMIVQCRSDILHTMNLYTTLALIRGAILTRVLGNSGLKQSMSIIPVGEIGLDESSPMMSQQLHDFVKEVNNIQTRFGVQKDLRVFIDRLKRIEHYITALFFDAHFIGTVDSKDDAVSLANSEDARNLYGLMSDPHLPLLPIAKSRPNIPASTYFDGPYAFEYWKGVDFDEAVRTYCHTAGHKKILWQLIKELEYLIDGKHLEDVPGVANLKNRLFPIERPIRKYYKNFHTLFKNIYYRETEHSVSKKLLSENLWFVFPAATGQLMNYFDCQPNDGNKDIVRPLPEADEWLARLSYAFKQGTPTFPVVTSHTSRPWAGAISMENPIDIDRVYDDRYFMASSELNLLNAMLLHSDERIPRGEETPD